ncbi:hypothetical protein IE53DRAFT_318251 [Violaceomyces palustris]|uniref:Uncharacterized protein n=1 Tax=Violaceomyces palustris TaxID=1673888 RepID=A0ACD0NTG1_9BASI|nr:hypothetical protein IE53DRAFT_318251 [Violaceomyces palustris]
MIRSQSQNTSYSGRSRNPHQPDRTNSIQPHAVSEPAHVIEGPSGRILCVADVRGNISSLNKLAAENNAKAIIHTGDFGFYEASSLERISDRTLRHLVQYSTLISTQLRNKLLGPEQARTPAPANTSNGPGNSLRQQVQAHAEPLLSEFPYLLDGRLKLDVPVFTIWGACEDVAILERFRTGEYQVANLYIVDEAISRAIEVGGVRLRLFGLGGALVLHKLFDNGEGNATIAGGQGTMWTTALQIGELVDTAQKTFDPTETRLLITHASPGREGILAQLALALKADLTISAGLHFRYGVSYNEFSVQHDAENYRNKLISSKQAFGEIWDTVKTQVEAVIDENQRILLNHALAVTNRIPPNATATGAASEEPAWKNTWNWNLPDAAHGTLVLDIKDGRIGAETKSQGFNFAFRRNVSSVAPLSAPAKAPPADAVSQAPGSGSLAVSPQASKASNGISAAPTATAAQGKQAPVGGAQGPVQPKQQQKEVQKDKKRKEKGYETSGSRSDIDGGLTSGTDGAGKSPSVASTPARNPNTIYLSQLGEALPVTQDDIKSYFGPAASGIVYIKMAYENFSSSKHRRGLSSASDQGGKKQRPFAYVEFKDEESMMEGLKRQGETIKGTTVIPKVEKADRNRATSSQAKVEKRERPKKEEIGKKDDKGKDSPVSQKETVDDGGKETGAKSGDEGIINSPSGTNAKGAKSKKERKTHYKKTSSKGGESEKEGGGVGSAPTKKVVQAKVEDSAAAAAAAKEES